MGTGVQFNKSTCASWRRCCRCPFSVTSRDNVKLADVAGPLSDSYPPGRYTWAAPVPIACG